MSRLRRSPSAKTKSRLEAGPTKRHGVPAAARNPSMPCRYKGRWRRKVTTTKRGGACRRRDLSRREGVCRGRGGAELAGGEIFQGAKACVEFGGRQAALAVKNAQKIRGRTVALARVAFHTGGNQVAVGIASEAHAWHDVVEALHVSGSAAKAVKASAAFAIVNGFAERPGFQEIRGFEGG